MVVLVYVDDILITGDNNTIIETFIKYLGETFTLKDLGEFSYFLGIEVTHAAKGSLHLSQAKYAYNLLARVGLTNSQIASTALDPNIKFVSFDGTHSVMLPFIDNWFEVRFI